MTLDKSNEKPARKKRRLPEKSWLGRHGMTLSKFNSLYDMGELIADGSSAGVSMLQRRKVDLDSRPLVCKVLPKKKEVTTGTAEHPEQNRYQNAVVMVRWLQLSQP